jgi:hypothetical protein
VEENTAQSPTFSGSSEPASPIVARKSSTVRSGRPRISDEHSCNNHDLRFKTIVPFCWFVPGLTDLLLLEVYKKKKKKKLIKKLIKKKKKKKPPEAGRGRPVYRPAPMDRLGGKGGYLPLMLPLASAVGFVFPGIVVGTQGFVVLEV